jgi:hypothetical protein
VDFFDVGGFHGLIFLSAKILTRRTRCRELIEMQRTLICLIIAAFRDGCYHTVFHLPFNYSCAIGSRTPSCGPAPVAEFHDFLISFGAV